MAEEGITAVVVDDDKLYVYQCPTCKRLQREGSLDGCLGPVGSPHEPAWFYATEVVIQEALKR